MPGCYESIKAARYAFQFSDSVLQTLQNEADDREGGSEGTITENDLKMARDRMIDSYTLEPLDNG